MIKARSRKVLPAWKPRSPTRRFPLGGAMTRAHTLKNPPDEINVCCPSIEFTATILPVESPT